MFFSQKMVIFLSQIGLSFTAFGAPKKGKLVFSLVFEV